MPINLWTGEIERKPIFKTTTPEATTEAEYVRIPEEKKIKLEFPKPEDISELVSKVRTAVEKISMVSKFAKERKEIGELKKKLSELTVEKEYAGQKEALLKQIEEMEKSMGEKKAEELKTVVQ